MIICPLFPTCNLPNPKIRKAAQKSYQTWSVIQCKTRGRSKIIPPGNLIAFASLDG